MSDQTRITQQIKKLVKTSDTAGWFEPVLVLLLLGVAISHAAYQFWVGDWLELVFSSLTAAFLFTLAVTERLQKLILRRRFNRRHALYISLFWGYGILWIWTMRVLLSLPSTGKDSLFYYVMLLMAVMLLMMMLRSLFALTPVGYALFIVRLPVWEQLLVAVNELAAAALLANVSAGIVTRALQPQVFTLRVDPGYTLGLFALTLIYYLGMWAMWFKVANEWLSRNDIWVRLARVVAPLALIVISLLINRHFAALGDPRTMDLLGDADFNMAVLAIAPVVWLLVLVVIFLVYTSSQGLRRRFLPDMLLQRLSPRLGNILGTISDADIVLMVGVLSTSIPVYIFLRGNSGGVVGDLREQIFQSADVLIESSEQALALLFALPFYLLIVGLLVIYALALSNTTVSAQDRDELVNRLPIGFLIVLIITLYLFAVPFSQVLIEGRLPRLPQDLGRILAFDVLIPLVLLYSHYFVLVRLPYGRGQSRWRTQREAELTRDLAQTDRDIKNIDRDLARLDRTWHSSPSTIGERDPNLRLNVLYEFVDLNGRRDKLTMKRLEIVAEKQQLAEVTEAPVSLAVARLPIRVVTIGIPLLLAIQIYQWAVLNDGLRQIANDPNITIVEFFQIILQQANF